LSENVLIVIFSTEAVTYSSMPSIRFSLIFWFLEIGPLCNCCTMESPPSVHVHFSILLPQNPMHCMSSAHVTLLLEFLIL
jgi:hypothetical protein